MKKRFSSDEYFHELQRDFNRDGKVSFQLNRNQSKYLGRLIKAWYRVNRYKYKPRVISWLYKYIDQKYWLILMNRSFVKQVKVSQVFRFYILYKGGKALYIKAENDKQNQNVKNITIGRKIEQV